MLPVGMNVVCTLPEADVPEPLKVAVPSVVEPTAKVTEPVGVFEFEVAVTVADKVTGVPYVPLAGVAIATVVLGSFSVTKTAVGEDVDPGKVVSPLYIAVKLWGPPGRGDGVKLTMPLTKVWGVPSCAPLSMKVTVPVGVPLPEAVTVAVRVTG